MSDLAAQLRELATREDLITATHVAIEDTLIELRDSRITFGLHANGLVCKEKDGTPSPVIRLGTKQAILQILTTLAEKLEAEKK